MRFARASYVAGLALMLAAACDERRPPAKHVSHVAALPAAACGRTHPQHGALCGVAYPRTGAVAFMPDASNMDASAISTLDAGAVDARVLTPEERLQMRGEYLVRHVAACMECHTPRLPSGDFDKNRLLSGVENLADLEPADDTRGMVHSRNLTPDEETGLGKWSDEQIKKAFQQGIDDEGKTLSWMMPYWVFHNMKADDADAIVAFLRSIPAVVHEVPENQPLSVELTAPYELPLAAIPETGLSASHPDFESAERGRYLATAVSPCALCHTPVVPGDNTLPIDAAQLFAGRRKWAPVKLGVAFDMSAPQIDSFNITPHTNGIGSFSAMDVANTLRVGVGRSALPVCDPMPSGTFGSFLGMSPQDALDIGHYLTTIPPIDTGVIKVCCTACHKGGASDAGGS